MLVTADEFEVQLQQYKELGNLHEFLLQTNIPSLCVRFIFRCKRVSGILLTVSLFHHAKYSNEPKVNGLGEALFPLLVVQGYVATLGIGSVAGRLNKISKLLTP